MFHTEKDYTWKNWENNKSKKGYHVRVCVLNGVITKILKTEDANTSGAATNPRSNKQTYTM
jgi:uncharacterized protein (DUF2147 family)